MSAIAISPLQINQFTRDYWGHFDPWIISQLAPLYESDCYQPKIYKSPASADEVIQPGKSVQHGLKITPGSLIYGFYCPALVATGAPPLFNLQITDQSLRHKFFDEPIPSIFIGNGLANSVSANPLLANGAIGAFPNLLNAAYPVTGDGLFMVQLWNPGSTALRVELVIGVLEVIGCD